MLHTHGDHSTRQTRFPAKIAESRVRRTPQSACLGAPRPATLPGRPPQRAGHGPMSYDQSLHNYGVRTRLSKRAGPQTPGGAVEVELSSSAGSWAALVRAGPTSRWEHRRASNEGLASLGSHVSSARRRGAL